MDPAITQPGQRVGISAGQIALGAGGLAAAAWLGTVPLRMRPERLFSHPDVTRLLDAPVAQVLDATARFSIDKGGNISAAGSGGEALLRDRPQVVRGIVELVRESGGSLKALTLADSLDGEIIGSAEHLLSPSRVAVAAAFNAHRLIGRAAVNVAVDDLHLGMQAFVANGDRMVVGVQATRGLLGKGSQDDLATGLQVIAHEVEHTVTPDGSAMWFEEGLAETLSAWPGRVAATGDKLGISVPDAWRTTMLETPVAASYKRRHGRIRTLLELGGINTSTAADYQAARELLQQSGSERGTAHAIAERIAQQQNLSDDAAQDIADVLLHSPDEKGVFPVLREAGVDSKLIDQLIVRLTPDPS